MIFSILVGFLAGILWIVGLGILFVKCIKPSDLRGSHKEGGVLVFFSAFGRAIFLSPKVINSSSEVIIARCCLVILVIFLVSFSVGLVGIIEHNA
jgi:hypothetical protein